MSLSIRPLEARDNAAITRIYAHAVRHGTASFETEPPDAAEMARREAALAAGGYPFLVAELAGTVAGYAYAGPYRARPAYRFTVEEVVMARLATRPLHAPERDRARISTMDYLLRWYNTPLHAGYDNW